MGSRPHYGGRRGLRTSASGGPNAPGWSRVSEDGFALTQSLTAVAVLRGAPSPPRAFLDGATLATLTLPGTGTGEAGAAGDRASLGARL